MLGYMDIFSSIAMILFLIFVVILFVFGGNAKIKMKNIKETYGYLDNKLIDDDNVHFFRDIPCDGNIYYAYVLIKLNNFDFGNVNILGAIILKWIKEKKIFIREVNRIRMIDLTIKNSFIENSFEDKLFKMMYEASCDGILEIKEFYKWAKNYDIRFLSLFGQMESEIINLLKKETHIYYRITDEDFYYDYVMDDKIYEDSVKLYGFKKFLDEFTDMDMKEIKELHLWEDYLIFAALFGMTDKIFNHLKEMYSDIEELDMYDLL